MAPSLPRGQGSPTSKNSPSVMVQRVSGLQERNTRSARFFGARIAAAVANTKDNDDADGDGERFLATCAGCSVEAFAH